MLNRGRIARKLGFSSKVRTQYTLPSRKNRPDLWCDAGVVGDAKNQVHADWGPEQIERYIDECQEVWPKHKWRGVLFQGEPEMAPNALKRLEASRYRDRIEVWSVRRRRRGLPVATQKLFPP